MFTNIIRKVSKGSNHGGRKRIDKTELFINDKNYKYFNNFHYNFISKYIKKGLYCRRRYATYRKFENNSRIRYTPYGEVLPADTNKLNKTGIQPDCHFSSKYKRNNLYLRTKFQNKINENVGNKSLTADDTEFMNYNKGDMNKFMYNKHNTHTCGRTINADCISDEIKVADIKVSEQTDDYKANNFLFESKNDVYSDCNKMKSSDTDVDYITKTEKFVNSGNNDEQINMNINLQFHQNNDDIGIKRHLEPQIKRKMFEGLNNDLRDAQHHYDDKGYKKKACMRLYDNKKLTNHQSSFADVRFCSQEKFDIDVEEIAMMTPRQVCFFLFERLRSIRLAPLSFFKNIERAIMPSLCMWPSRDICMAADCLSKALRLYYGHNNSKSFISTRKSQNKFISEFGQILSDEQEAIADISWHEEFLTICAAVIFHHRRKVLHRDWEKFIAAADNIRLNPLGVISVDAKKKYAEIFCNESYNNQKPAQSTYQSNGVQTEDFEQSSFLILPFLIKVSSALTVETFSNKIPKSICIVDALLLALSEDIETISHDALVAISYAATRASGNHQLFFLKADNCFRNLFKKKPSVSGTNYQLCSVTKQAHFDSVSKQNWDDVHVLAPTVIGKLAYTFLRKLNWSNDHLHALPQTEATTIKFQKHQSMMKLNAYCAFDWLLPEVSKSLDNLAMHFSSDNQLYDGNCAWSHFEKECRLGTLNETNHKTQGDDGNKIFGLNKFELHKTKRKLNFLSASGVPVHEIRRNCTFPPLVAVANSLSRGETFVPDQFVVEWRGLWPKLLCALQATITHSANIGTLSQAAAAVARSPHIPKQGKNKFLLTVARCVVWQEENTGNDKLLYSKERKTGNQYDIATANEMNILNDSPMSSSNKRSDGLDNLSVNGNADPSTSGFLECNKFDYENYDIRSSNGLLPKPKSKKSFLQPLQVKVLLDAFAVANLDVFNATVNCCISILLEYVRENVNIFSSDLLVYTIKALAIHAASAESFQAEKTLHLCKEGRMVVKIGCEVLNRRLAKGEELPKQTAVDLLITCSRMPTMPIRLVDTLREFVYSDRILGAPNGIGNSKINDLKHLDNEHLNIHEASGRGQQYIFPNIGFENTTTYREDKVKENMLFNSERLVACFEATSRLPKRIANIRWKHYEAHLDEYLLNNTNIMSLDGTDGTCLVGDKAVFTNNTTALQDVGACNISFLLGEKRTLLRQPQQLNLLSVRELSRLFSAYAMAGRIPSKRLVASCLTSLLHLSDVLDICIARQRACYIQSAIPGIMLQGEDLASPSDVNNGSLVVSNGLNLSDLFILMNYISRILISLLRLGILPQDTSNDIGKQSIAKGIDEDYKTSLSFNFKNGRLTDLAHGDSKTTGNKPLGDSSFESSLSTDFSSSLYDNIFNKYNASNSNSLSDFSYNSNRMVGQNDCGGLTELSEHLLLNIWTLACISNSVRSHSDLKLIWNVATHVAHASTFLYSARLMRLALYLSREAELIRGQESIRTSSSSAKLKIKSNVELVDDVGENEVVREYKNAPSVREGEDLGPAICRARNACELHVGRFMSNVLLGGLNINLLTSDRLEMINQPELWHSKSKTGIHPNDDLTVKLKYLLGNEIYRAAEMSLRAWECSMRCKKVKDIIQDGGDLDRSFLISDICSSTDPDGILSQQNTHFKELNEFWSSDLMHAKSPSLRFQTEVSSTLRRLGGLNIVQEIQTCFFTIDILVKPYTSSRQNSEHNFKNMS